MKRLVSGLAWPASVIACSALLLSLACKSAVSSQSSFTSNQSSQAEEPRWIPPPGEETSDIKLLIDKAQAALAGGKTDPKTLLTDPAYMSAHEWPRFRSLIREYSRTNQIVIVTPQEPGDSLVVTGALTNQRGEPVKDALVYFYQTSAKGWYSDKAPHVSGNSGDERHARLFGYLRSNQDGQYEFRTIRPAGYPRSDLPAHIHVEIDATASGGGTFITEIQFDDDPRLTAEMRQRSQRDRFVIVPVKREANGGLRVKADFKF